MKIEQFEIHQEFETVKLTPYQYAEMIRKNKPYILEIEEHVDKLPGGYGSIEVKIEVRAKEVEKMSFFNQETWLRPKKVDEKPQ